MLSLSRLDLSVTSGPSCTVSESVGDVLEKVMLAGVCTDRLASTSVSACMFAEGHAAVVHEGRAMSNQPAPDSIHCDE